MTALTSSVKIGVAIAALVGAIGVTTWAQGLGPSSSGSLSELTAEVKQLRLTVQEAGRNQTQMQAVNISLTSQLSRLTQVSARVDVGQQELQKAAEMTQELVRRVASVQADAASFTSPADRAQFNELVQAVKEQLDRAQATENRLQIRQSELLNTFRVEEGRWNELVAKLEEIIKR